MLPFNKSLKSKARALRKNKTEAEQLLWSKVRRKQLKGKQFYRQKNIGNYIVDFYCAAAKLVIELDGSQHYTKEGRAKDQGRDAYLQNLGLRVVRFSDTDVLKNTDAVVERIYKCL
jgi:very-short-patch-repair endonuclease